MLLEAIKIYMTASWDILPFASHPSNALVHNLIACLPLIILAYPHVVVVQNTPHPTMVQDYLKLVWSPICSSITVFTAIIPMK